MASGSAMTSGGGFNLLVAAARMGFPSAYGGLVGDGVFGAQVLEDLSAARIPMLLPQVRGRDSGFTLGLVEPDGERTFVTSPGIEAELEPAHLASLQLEEADAIYLSGYDLCYPTSGQSLQRWLGSIDVTKLVVFDPGPLVDEIPPERLEAALRRSNIVSLNRREAELLGATGDGGDAAEHVGHLSGPEALTVLRAGAEGCWIAPPPTRPDSIRPGSTHVPARPTRARDTTGAGDTHVAVLVARLAEGDGIVEAARWANVAASIAVEYRGPHTGPTAKTVRQAMNEGPFGELG